MSATTVETSEGAPTGAPVPPPPAPALGRAAATGFLLMSGQSLLTRVMTFGAQIVVARYLTKEQTGMAFIAISVARYSDLAQQIGVREVLLARQKRFHLWQNAGWWVAMAAGLAAALATAVAAPITAWLYHDSTLLWLLLIVAVSQPLYNVTLVQETKLQIDLRFKYLAMGQLAQGALGPGAQVGMVFARMGSYAMIVPRVIVGAAKWWIYAGAAKIAVRRDPQWRLWKYILVPGGLVVATNLAYNIAPTVPTFVLGWVGGAGSQIGKAFAGEFNFAFNLSLQAMLLLSMQLDSILFPTLGKMADDPVRQRGALLRSGHALAAVMAPVCMLQIVAARPIVSLFFSPANDPHKWDGAVLPFQIMSGAMFVAGAFVPAHSLLQSQSRFGLKFVIALVWGVIAAMVSIAGIIFAPMEWKVAAATAGLALAFTASPMHQCIAAARRIGGGTGDALRILGMPLVIGVLAGWLAVAAEALVTPRAGAMLVGVAAWVVSLTPKRLDEAHVLVQATDLLRLMVLGAVGTGAFLVMLRLLAPGVWADLMHAAAPILRRVRVYLPRALRGKDA